MRIFPLLVSIFQNRLLPAPKTKDGGLGSFVRQPFALTGMPGRIARTVEGLGIGEGDRLEWLYELDVARVGFFPVDLEGLVADGGTLTAT